MLTGEYTFCIFACMPLLYVEDHMTWQQDKLPSPARNQPVVSVA